MKRNLKKRLLSLAMCIVLLGQIGFLSGVSAQTSTDPDEETITSYAAYTPGVLYRYAFFTYMHNRVLPNEVNKDNLTSLSVKVNEANGLAAYEFRGSFSYQGSLVQRTYTISLIAGNKKFWNEVINSSEFKSDAAINLVLAISQTLLTYFDGLAFITNSSDMFLSVGEKWTLKSAAESLEGEDMLVYVPGFTLYQKLGIIPLNQDLLYNIFIIYSSELDTWNPTIPDWVYNGSSVTVV